MSARYKTATFRASHNSYSGDIRGARGAVRAQLDAGVRFVELDLHPPAAPGGDFRLGHRAPGDEVAAGGGNPASTALRDWLAVVAAWARGRAAAAAVVTVGLDFKVAAGPLQALNDALREELGELLVTPREFRALAAGHEDGPTLDALKGRVMVVLSGHEKSRTEYMWDTGVNPAVAANDAGWVVEVHESPGGPTALRTLWYWTGRRRRTGDGGVEWMHHGQFDRGTTPAVALNNAGLVVEVHRSGVHRTLWARTGQLHAKTGAIAWSPAAERYDKGVEPTVAFDSLDGAALREVHRSPWRYDDTWSRRGAAAAGGVKWEGSAKTQDRPFVKNVARMDGGVGASAAAVELTVDSAAAAGGGAPVPNTLLYTCGGAAGRIVYPELAFVEWQSGNADELAADGVLFHANKALRVDWIARQRAAGHIVRQWAFNTPAHGTQPPSNFPATDHPYADWYDEYCNEIGAVKD